MWDERTGEPKKNAGETQKKVRGVKRADGKFDLKEGRTKKREGE